MLDVPLQLASFLAELLADHRRDIGTRHGTRALTCWKQAVFALAWFRDRPDIPRLGDGFGISQATAYRYWTKRSRCWQPARRACARRWRRQKSRDCRT